ncbi:hypothetical protein PCANC_22843 [Puccinia coronata f. sp. avenae]|uniref:GOLD domain-containing protein n=1 Tax=Puccinia coronata f. sp. avenae TaxID=200324 RepID=A0A2N5S9Z5_9BASI|nr:hypothetical protein PCANC_22843 [Puccinia coronata f. sp. avenae]
MALNTLRRLLRKNSRTTPFLCSLLLWVGALSHTIDVQPGQVSCFFEDLHVDDKMTITFQVGGGGHLDIDFWLNDPAGTHLWNVVKRDTGTFTFTATQGGKHEYCFSNAMSTVSSKTVSFNVYGVMWVVDDAHMAPIELEIKHLASALEAVKEEQQYIVVREKLHRNTAESTNDRVKWWSLVQTAMVLGVTAWQVFYLKRFFEVKRVSLNPLPLFVRDGMEVADTAQSPGLAIQLDGRAAILQLDNMGSAVKLMH